MSRIFLLVKISTEQIRVPKISRYKYDYATISKDIIYKVRKNINEHSVKVAIVERKQEFM